MLKHRLKRLVRRAYAGLLFHTGLHRVVDRLMPRRMTILFGHCVTAPATNGFLPPDMKIRGERLERILSWLGERYALVTIGEGVERLGQPARRARPWARRGPDQRSLVALSMDDGYRDNREALLPILERTGARATIFLETRPLDERRVNWSHKMFWMLARGASIHAIARGYAERTQDQATRAKLEHALAADGDAVYQVKRVLKYDAEPADREATIDALFQERGGDEPALARALYMSWDDARALRDAGVELGGHTVHHHVLSTLPPPAQEAEVEGCARAMQRALGERPKVFAYPFGRRWDFDRASVEAVRKAGFELAVDTHAGTNRGPGYALKRLPIDDAAELPLLVAEACGGFDLLRKVGIDLSE